MSAWMLKSLLHTAVLALLISALTVASVSSAHAEAIFIFRTAGDFHQEAMGARFTSQRKVFLKLDENGDLLIQLGKTKFTVAYNAPSDLLKPSDQRQNLQFGNETSAINGISLKASLSF